MLLAVAVLIIAGLAAWVLWPATDDQAPVLQAPTTGTISESVTAQGTLEPYEYVDVGAQVSGRLERVAVDAGDQVTPGQLIAEIDPRVYQSQLEQAQARLASLQAQLKEQQAQTDLARQQNARNRTLAEAQAVSRETFEISTADLAAAQARVGSLQAQIREARSTASEQETNLGFTKIYAPISGTVVSTSVRAGQTINASQQAPTIVRVADLSTMTARAQVAEADVRRITPGMPASFTTLGDDREWQGQVRQILPAPEVVNDVVLYNVLVDVANPDGALMDGMSTQMSFVLGQASNATLIPAGVLTEKLPAAATDGAATARTERYRIAVQDARNQPVSRTVVVGLMDRQHAQVLSGLQAGDQVILPAGSARTEGGSGSRRMMGPRL